MAAGLYRIASVVLGLAAVALFWLAFTQFDDEEAPQPGSPAYAEYEEKMMHAAQRSIGSGLAGCFVLLGAFACHQRAANQPAPEGSEPAGPQP